MACHCGSTTSDGPGGRSVCSTCDRTTDFCACPMGKTDKQKRAAEAKRLAGESA